MEIFVCGSPLSKSSNAVREACRWRYNTRIIYSSLRHHMPLAEPEARLIEV